MGLGLGIGISLGRVAPGGFSPTQLGSTVLAWVKADGTVTKDGGNLVSSAGDIGGPFVQSTAGNKPLWVASAYNGRPTLRGNDQTDHLAAASEIASGTGAGTIIVALKKSSAASSYEFVNGALAAGIISNFSGSLVEWFNGADRYTLANNPSGLHIYAIRQTNGVNLQLFLDGTQVGTDHVPGVAFPGLKNICGRSGANGTNGDLAELLYCDTALSDSHLLATTRYMGSRFGVTVA